MQQGIYRGTADWSCTVGIIRPAAGKAHDERKAARALRFALDFEFLEKSSAAGRNPACSFD
jgi:hypothetical protein